MKSILIADDDEIVRSAFCAILKQEGYSVIEACNGIEAIKRSDEHQPDLVMVDLFMPEKDGIETLFELKQQKRDIKVIIISGGGRLEPVKYLGFAKTLGAAATLIKPFTTEELKATINRVLTDG